MAKARAIVKRRKAVRNIKKITKTMQMIATAKYQKSLKRAVATKPYTLKVRELVAELAASVGNVEHPLLRRVAENPTNRISVLVLTSNRGLAGAYNGNVLRAANHFIRQQEAAGKKVQLYTGGKKAASYFRFLKREVTGRHDLGDSPSFEAVDRVAQSFMDSFVAGSVDAVYIVYMNFITASSQKPDVLKLLPLDGVKEALAHIKQQAEEKVTAAQGATLVGDVRTEHAAVGQTIYDFSPEPRELLDELLPLTVKTTAFQAFLDATTSEHVARMISMKSATDNADKMVKSLTMQYNRARQSQITTELSEIMGGVEAMG